MARVLGILFFMSEILKKIYEDCSKGFYPIVKDADGDYAIFTPFKDEDGNYCSSHWKEEIDDCDLSKGIRTYAPSIAIVREIVDYYHPPFEPLKVGDKVRVRKDLEHLQCDGDFSSKNEEYKKSAGKIGVVNFCDGYRYTVHLTNGDKWHYAHHQLEPAIEEEQKPQTIQIGDDVYEFTAELQEALKNLKKVD